MTTSYLSISEFTGDGVTTEWDFNFAGGYISRDHVFAYTQSADGVVTHHELTFVSDFRVVVTPAVPVGDTLRIYRNTPREEPIVNFTGGSNFTEANLDLLARQTVFVAAEAFDAGSYAYVNDLLAAATNAQSEAAASALEALAAAEDSHAAATEAATEAAELVAPALAAKFASMMNRRGEWAPATPYFAENLDGTRDTFWHTIGSETKAYVVVQDHTSGVFATDLAAGKFIENDTAQLIVDLESSNGSLKVGFLQAGAGAIPRTVQNKSRERLSILDFYANGVSGPAVDPTGVIDSTLGIQAAINSVMLAGSVYVPAGVYKITSTLRVLGNQRNITLYGDNGVKSIVPGGVNIDTASIFEWHGAAGGVILELDSVEGTSIEKISFKAKDSTGNDTLADIFDVVGIRYINKSSCRMSTIEKCGFALLGIGVHYFDDLSNPSSNTNMDGHGISNCIFRNCSVGIEIDQTNVYDTEIFRCSFFGSGEYTKHHVNIVKGHAYINSCYLGPLKGDLSAGGKNGIAIYVQNGYVNMSDCYGECHNGPFFVWEIAQPAGVTSTLTGCWILNATASLPAAYNLLSKVNGSQICIVGGRIAGAVEQFAGTTGSITYISTFAPSATAASEPNAVCYVGSNYSAKIGPIGSMPNGTSGGGIATLSGYAPKLILNDATTSNSCHLKLLSKVFTVDIPGTANGPAFDFNTKEFNLANTGWCLVEAALTTSQRNVIPSIKIGRTLFDTTLGKPIWFKQYSGRGAGSFSIGKGHKITAIGTTDFTLIGAASNTVGVVFIASGAGSGSGAANMLDWVDSSGASV